MASEQRAQQRLIEFIDTWGVSIATELRLGRSREGTDETFQSTGAVPKPAGATKAGEFLRESELTEFCGKFYPAWCRTPFMRTMPSRLSFSPPRTVPWSNTWPTLASRKNSTITSQFSGEQA